MQNPNDPFGMMMVENFKQTGCALAGISFFNSQKDTQAHYQAIFKPEGDQADTEFSFEIYNMNLVTAKCLDEKEFGRIMTLEFLDEYEQYMMMQDHYFMSTAKYLDKSQIDTTEKENGGVVASDVITNFQMKLI